MSSEGALPVQTLFQRELVAVGEAAHAQLQHLLPVVDAVVARVPRRPVIFNLKSNRIIDNMKRNETKFR